LILLTVLSRHNSHELERHRRGQAKAKDRDLPDRRAAITRTSAHGTGQSSRGRISTTGVIREKAEFLSLLIGQSIPLDLAFFLGVEDRLIPETIGHSLFNLG